MQLPRVQTEFTARVSTDPMFRALTAWRPSVDTTSAAALLELVQTSSTSLVVAPAWQVCRFNPDDPALSGNLRGWEQLGTATVNVGGTRAFTQFVDLSGATYPPASNFWIRFGLRITSSGGPLVARAVVAATFSTRL